MITPEQHAEIRRLYFGEHWKVGTIVANLGVHPDTVRAAIALDTRVVRRGACRRSILDPYLPFIRDTLAQYPRLRATRLYEMLRPRGYAGSADQLRRLVRLLRPQVSVALYRRLVVLPAEEAQVDWGAFGSIRIGHGTRAAVRLRDGPLVLARPLRALHAGPDPRELSARPCPGLPGLRGICADPRLRQLEKCRARAPGHRDPLSSALARAWRGIIISHRGPAPRRAGMRKAKSSARSATSATRSSPRGPFAMSTTSMRNSSAGGTTSRISGPIPSSATRRWRRSSPRSRRGSCRCPPIPSRPISCGRWCPANSRTSASIATATRFPTPTSAARSRCWPAPPPCGSSRAPRRSPGTRAATTPAPRSRTRRISRACVTATQQANASSARDRLRLAVPIDRDALRPSGRARRGRSGRT